ncbi:glutaredoxin family protein [Ornithinibacillus sp. 179-J 7C1 HS]|uniref:glutaredoxin family protein n=1 Tax=Ornithinibacillus sp. 179-J 7C1 HS TaxID=3142384 RepID=UPI0039A15800
MEKVLLYTKENCSLCDNAEALLEMFQLDFDFEIEKRDIYTNDAWLENYHLSIPVIEIGGIQLNCEQVDYNSIETTLSENLQKK